jgi:hypothetical protein
VDGRKFTASDEDGRSWDVKGSMVNGVRPTFKFREAQLSAVRLMKIFHEDISCGSLQNTG